MRLFGEQGYRSTSVAQIEAAAGLTPGAGGLYHHFPSKEALLAAGIERHVHRLDALRDMRRIFLSLGDLRAELTVCARFVLTLLDEETQLLSLALAQPASRPRAVHEALERSLGSSYAEFAEWMAERVPALTATAAKTLAALGLNMLLADRITRRVLDVSPYELDDEALVTAWVDMIMIKLKAAGAA